MLVQQKETTLAYRCPACGATVFSLVGIFALSGDMLKLRCSCGESETVITYTREKKIRLTVPCITCPKPHHFTLGQTNFFAREKDVFRLPCPYTGIDACFIGPREAVLEAIDRSNEELVRLIEEAGMKDLSLIRGEKDEDALKSENPLLEDVVCYMLKELEEEEAIHCRCEKAKGDYVYRLHHGKVTISCQKCGAMATLPMYGVTAADRFLELTSLELD